MNHSHHHAAVDGRQRSHWCWWWKRNQLDAAKDNEQKQFFCVLHDLL